MSRTFDIEVRQVVRVTLDPAKFDEAFMAEFRKYFYDYDRIEDHAEHLAQLFARGISGNNDFIEGYGPANGMGIAFAHVEQSEEILP